MDKPAVIAGTLLAFCGASCVVVMGWMGYRVLKNEKDERNDNKNRRH